MALTLPDTANPGDPGHISDHNMITAALAALDDGPAWVAYTPTFTNFTANINLARYWQQGKLVSVTVHLTLTTTPTGVLVVSAPKPLDGTVKVMVSQLPLGVANGTIPNASGPVWPSTGAGHGFSFGAPPTPWGPGAPGAWGNGSVLGFTATYETT